MYRWGPMPGLIHSSPTTVHPARSVEPQGRRPSLCPQRARPSGSCDLNRPGRARHDRSPCRDRTRRRPWRAGATPVPDHARPGPPLWKHRCRPDHDSVAQRSDVQGLCRGRLIPGQRTVRSQDRQLQGPDLGELSYAHDQLHGRQGRPGGWAVGTSRRLRRHRGGPAGRGIGDDPARHDRRGARPVLHRQRVRADIRRADRAVRPSTRGEGEMPELGNNRWPPLGKSTSADDSTAVSTDMKKGPRSTQSVRDRGPSSGVRGGT